MLPQLIPPRCLTAAPDGWVSVPQVPGEGHVEDQGRGVAALVAFAPHLSVIGTPMDANLSRLFLLVLLLRMIPP